MRSFPGRHDSQPISDRRSPYFVRVSVATAKDGNMFYLNLQSLLHINPYIITHLKTFLPCLNPYDGISNAPNIMNTKTIRNLQKVSFHTCTETCGQQNDLGGQGYRFLYCRGVTMVGSFVPPPTNPLSLTQLSSFLSQVNVRIKSFVSTIYEMLDTNYAKDKVAVFFVNPNDKGVIHDIHLCQEQCIIPQTVSQDSFRVLTDKQRRLINN